MQSAIIHESRLKSFESQHEEIDARQNYSNTTIVHVLKDASENFSHFRRSVVGKSLST